jgi:hypothetical protein
MGANPAGADSRSASYQTCRQKAGGGESQGSHKAARTGGERALPDWCHSSDRRPIRGSEGRPHGIRQRPYRGADRRLDLDELVVARVRAAAAPGIAVRRIAYPKGAFEPYDNPAPALFRDPRDDLTAIVKQIATNASCNRYVVVTKFTGKLDGTNQTLRGIGILHHGTGFLSHTALFANVQVTVFDGQTFAIGKNPNANLGSILAGTFARMTTRDPLTELDNASFPEPAAEATNSAMLRDHVRALLSSNLDKTLPAFLKEE